MKPVRVLHILRALGPGGAETLLMNVFRRIDRSKISFDVAVMTGSREHYDDEFRSLGGRIFRLPEPREGLGCYGRAVWKILRGAGSFAAIHSHVHLFSAAPLLVARMAGVPIRVAHSHTTGVSNGPLYRRFMREGILNNSTHRLGCSEAACQSLFGTPARVFPNAIDFESYSSRELDLAAARARLGLSAAGLVIGHVGRFDEAKNHAALIAMLAGLRAAEPSCHALLVGDGPLRKSIEEECRLLQIASRVHFLGLRTDLPEILSALDCFVFPSRYEGLGLAVIEAQAIGVPCVVSDAVPPEVDLGLGLVERCGLAEPTAVWAKRILQAGARSRPDQARRRHAFTTSGYDIASSIHQWEEMYLSGPATRIKNSDCPKGLSLPQPIREK